MITMKVIQNGMVAEECCQMKQQWDKNSSTIKWYFLTCVTNASLQSGCKTGTQVKWQRYPALALTWRAAFWTGILPLSPPL